MTKRSKLIIGITSIVLLGFLRGYLFGNINWIYLTMTEGRPNAARDEFHFLLEWAVSNILILKWLLTFLFFGLFMFITLRLIKIMFNNAIFNRITLLVFVFLLLLSSLLYVFYLLVGSTGKLYAIIRTLMGLGQSFMPLMLLVIVFRFLPQEGRV